MNPRETKSLTIRLATGLVVVGFLVFTGIQFAHADTKQQLLKCTDTSFSTYYTTISCGGDVLTIGGIGITPGKTVHVMVKGASQLNYYEVYYLPTGASTTLATKVGSFLTDCNGDADTMLRSLTKPSDLFGPPVQIDTVLGRKKQAGNFIVYSRGPYGSDSDGDCKADTWNTSDGTMSGTFNNPAVSLSSDVVQFISGFSVP